MTDGRTDGETHLPYLRQGFSIASYADACENIEVITSKKKLSVALRHATVH